MEIPALMRAGCSTWAAIPEIPAPALPLVRRRAFTEIGMIDAGFISGSFLITGKNSATSACYPAPQLAPLGRDPVVGEDAPPFLSELRRRKCLLNKVPIRFHGFRFR